jgi:hypothetical protein
MLAAQQRAAPKLPVPSGFSPECALAALRSLLVAPLRDASHVLPARILVKMHQVPIDEMSSNNQPSIENLQIALVSQAIQFC